jgi:hypothetical protein
MEHTIGPWLQRTGDTYAFSTHKRGDHMTRTHVLGLALAALLGSADRAAAQATLAVPEGGGTASVTWTRGPYAAAANPTPQAGGVQASCIEGVTCASFPVTIDLPSDYWTRHYGSLSVSVAWPDHAVPQSGGAVENDFDIYVYDSSGNQVGLSASNADPEALRISDPRPGVYTVVAYFFTVVNQGFTGTATLDSTFGQLPAPVDDPTSIRFSPTVTVMAPASGRDTEPSTVVDQDGRWYVGGIRGVPAGVDMWVSTDRAGQSWKWLTRPDSLGVQDPVTGQFRQPAPSDGGGDLDFAVSRPPKGQVPRVYGSSLAAATVSSFYSEDTGRTWQLNPSATLATTEDRQWNIASGRDYAAIWVREPLTGPGFYLYQSTDGGRTYPFLTQVYPLNGTGGRPAINHATGEIYGVISSGADLVFAQGKRDAVTGIATTFTTKTIHTGSSHGNFFPGVAVDRAGNLYACWTDRLAVWYIWSRDNGATWSAPIRVSSGGANSTTLFAWMTVGDPGRAAFAWYGSSAQSNTDNNADWYVWFAQTLDGLSAAPTFTQLRASDHIIHHGNVSLGGFNVTDSTLNRNLADFFEIDIDPTTGGVVAAFADDHNDFDGHTYVTRQISGPSLYADVGLVPRIHLPRPPKATGPQVTDFEGDTTTTASTSVPSPQVDILSVQYGQETSSSGAAVLVVTMKVKDLTVVPPGASWRSYFSIGGEIPDKGDRYFVEATTDGITGAPAFFYGTAPRSAGGVITDTRVGAADGGSVTAGAPGTIVVRLGGDKVGNPPKGTTINGTLARATLALERQTLDRTRGGRAVIVK